MEGFSLIFLRSIRDQQVIAISDAYTDEQKLVEAQKGVVVTNNFTKRRIN